MLENEGHKLYSYGGIRINLNPSFAGWNEHVVVAAVNCAEQESCASFGIQGTPTVRMFLPGSTEGDQGIDLRAHAGVRSDG